MLNMSPDVLEAPPPSPAWMLMPGTLRSTSLSVVAPCSSKTARGMISMVCGTSRRGVTYFGDEMTAVGALPVTSTDCESTRNSSDTVFDVVNRKVTLVPSVMTASACSMVIVPVTPGDVMAPIDGEDGTIVRSVAASKAASTELRGPDGTSKVFVTSAAARS